MRKKSIIYESKDIEPLSHPDNLCSFSPYIVVINDISYLHQVLELQNTLDDLTHRVDKVKEENLKLKSENTVLGQYIENLMQASQVFQAVSPKSRRWETPFLTANYFKLILDHFCRKHRPQNFGSVIKCTAKAVRGAVGGDQ